MHIVEKVRTAKSTREIAGTLLRVPDAIVLSHGVQLSAESVRQHFAAGKAFLDVRAAGLHAVRDAHGLMPDGLSFDIEAWRHTFSEYAAGRRSTDTPGFMPVRGTNGEDTDPLGR